jgi:hypothetical protein
MVAGDFYLDSATANVYVKLSNGTAQLLLNLKGPQGASGNSAAKSVRIVQNASPTQTVQSGTVLAMGFLAWDTFSPTASPYNLLSLSSVAGATTLYHITAQVEFSAVTSGSREVGLYRSVDGNTWQFVNAATSPAVTFIGKTTTVNFSTLDWILSGTTFKYRLQATVADNLVPVQVLNSTTWLSAEYVGVLP